MGSQTERSTFARALYPGAMAFLGLMLACSGGGSSPPPTPATHTVVYAGNANTGGTVPVDANTYQQGAAVTLLGNTGGLVKTGSAFSGWNTAADGSGAGYVQGQTCAMGTANLTFYAHWVVAGPNSVTYDGNGATGGSVPVDATTYGNGSTVTVLGNSGGLTYTGYAFAGWQTKADGSGTTYKQGQTFTKGAANVTLYALWSGGQAYAVNYEGGTGGSISQYTIGPNGALTPMAPASVASGGSDPRYLAVDPLGKYVYASNMTSNTVSQFTIGADGALTAMATPTVLMGSLTGGKLYYPAGLLVHPSGKYVYVPLMQSSSLNQYAIGATGALAPLAPATIPAGEPGNGRNGPCRVALDPTSTFAYVTNGGANSISQYRVNADGTLSALTPFLVSSGGASGGGSAYDIKFLAVASGTYAYVANYFDGTIAQFSLNTATGQLAPLTPALVTSGSYLLSIAVHPTGKFVYAAILTGSASAVVAQFNVNAATGALTPMTTPTVSAGGAGAATITVEASGKYAYATSGDTGWGSTTIAQYAIDPTTGALTLLPNPTVKTGYGPGGIVTVRK